MLPSFCSTIHSFQDFDVPNVDLHRWAPLVILLFPQLCTKMAVIIKHVCPTTLLSRFLFFFFFTYLYVVPTFSSLGLCKYILLGIRIDNLKKQYHISNYLNLIFLYNGVYLLSNNYFDSLWVSIINDLYNTGQSLCLLLIG